MISDDYKDTGWLALMTADQQHLWRDARRLLDRELKDLSPDKANGFADYGFIVFPAAKAYEGFLKSYFYQMGLIAKNDYLDEYFRIGKALNPDLPRRFRDDTWVFDDLSIVCGFGTAKQLWQAWKLARNEVFHFDVRACRCLTLEEAEQRVEALRAAMQAAAACEVRVKREG